MAKHKTRAEQGKTRIRIVGRHHRGEEKKKRIENRITWKRRGDRGKEDRAGEERRRKERERRGEGRWYADLS